MRPQAAVTMAFTMQDEARHTTHSRTPWSLDDKLFRKPVPFVSAGWVDPLEGQGPPQLEEPPGQAVDVGIATLDKAEDILGALSTPQLGDDHASIKDLSEPPKTGEDTGDALASVPDADPYPEEEPPSFFDMTGGNARLSKGGTSISFQPEPASPTDSTSSEEVILFRGRNQQRTKIRPTFNLAEIRTEVEVVERTIIQIAHQASSSRASSAHPTRSPAPKQYPKAKPTPKDEEEEEILADYIANMRAHADDRGDGEGSSTSASRIRLDVADSSRTFGAEPGGGEDDGPRATESAHGSESDESGSDESEGGGEQAPIKRKVAKQGNASPPTGEEDDLELIDMVRAKGSLFVEETFDPEEQRVYDIQDWERPSLRRRKKGAKGKLSLINVSDDEMAALMEETFDNDRLKKAQRKKEREELRAKGLLAKSAEPDDLRVKYPTGITLEQVIDEMRIFLAGDDQQ
jgi:hypothetical protein